MMPPGGPELFGTCGTEKVLKIDLEQAGQLSTALATAQQQGLDFQYLHLKTAPHAGTITLSDDDIAALNALDITTIDLQTANIAFPENKTLNNSKVSYIMLPLGWTKAQVKAVGETHKDYANFKACLSTSDTKNNGDATLIAYLGQANTMADAIRHTYFTKNDNNVEDTKTLGNGQGDCGRLRNLVVMGNFCAKDISRQGTYDENGHFITSGTPDENSTTFNINTNGNPYYVGCSTNGDITGLTAGAISGCHEIYSIDLSDGYVPDEYCSDIVVQFLGFSSKTSLTEVLIPTDSRFKTIPADYLNCSCAVHQICIPGNIETIRTRAFAGTNVNYIWTTGSDPSVRYDNGATFITSSGDSEVRTQRYKTEVGSAYTATEAFDPAVEYPRFVAGDDNSFNYGTFTLPAGLRLIERFAFYSSTSVSDVYILNPVAPECHVDGFNSSMYHANNTVKAENIKEETDEDGHTIKIITRDAYNNGINQPMAMLHYPQNTATPNTQRYTDPTREYSIATGDRDGRGNMLYFPTQTEFEVAEWEGTYGYLWNAWNIDRTWYNQEVMLGTGRGWYGGDFSTTGGYSQAGQAKANDFYVNNPDTIRNSNNPKGKIDRSFYDVTFNGSLSQPEGLDMYYNSYRSEQQLYPQAVSTTSNYVYVRDDNGDYVLEVTTSGTAPNITNALQFRKYAGSADDALERYSRKQVPVLDNQGNQAYETCDGGKYVQDFEWQANDAGEYVKETIQDGYASTNVIVDGVTTYYSDAEGTTAVTPQVGSGMYVEGGTDDDYTLIDPNSETIGGRDKYYTTSDGGQTYQESYLKFDQNQIGTVYVTTGGTTINYYNTTVNGNNVLKFGVAHYYSDAAGQNEVNPTITSINGNGTLYFKDSEGAYHATTTFVQGEGDYYVEYSHAPGTYYPIGDYNDQVYINGTYYYGKEEPAYVHPEYYIPGTTYYNYQNWNNTYVEKTDGFGWHQISGAYTDYYYVSGSHPAYISAQGEDYDASTTYYSDANGTNVATTIRLNSDYYIPNYVDLYREAQTGDEGLPHYKKNYLGTYHVATAADVNEPRYCPMTEDYESDTPITYTKQNDYRGWHQFVLAGYGYNGVVPNEPIRSFISDNDWWTICEPYDLRYNDMVMFFGTDHASLPKKIPYLSKLMYVVRDVKEGKITLMFSKNLMEYKETVAGTDQVHGTIGDTDDDKWTPEELAENPIILHKGVPYLIKPNLMVDDSGNITGTRQFNVYKTDDPELYSRLNEAAKLGAAAHANMIYDGIYTVPSYVVGLGEEGAGTEAVESTGEKTITNKDGSSFTYKDSEHGGKLIYGGKEVSYKISSVNTYSFVGSFYKSLMPQYCYFLGWDSKKNCATFWYSAVQDQTGWNWNNETGIICPNFPTDTKVSSASSFNDPARWKIADANGSLLRSDDITMPTSAPAKNYTFDFGATNYFELDEATGVSEMIVKPAFNETKVYDANGVYRGTSLQNLPKGVYIVNGQKYVVK